MRKLPAGSISCRIPGKVWNAGNIRIVRQGPQARVSLGYKPIGSIGTGKGGERGVEKLIVVAIM